jgi:hypothetical protein
MRHAAVLAAVAVALGTVTVASSPAAALEQPYYELPSGAFRNVVVDEAHGRVFVTYANGSIAVRTLDGANAGSLPFVSGHAVLSADGATLYAPLPLNHAIVAIDTTTLTERTRYATGECPASVAELGDTLWFGYGCDGTGDIGAVDLSGETPVVTLDRTESAYGAAPLVRAGGSTVVGAAGTALYSYAASGATLTALATRTFGASVRDVALSSDGTKVTVAPGATTYSHPRYTTADLEPDGGLGAATETGTAVALAPDGSAAIGLDAPGGRDVRTFNAAGTQVRSYELYDPVKVTLAPGGLALGAGRLYAVSTHLLYGGPLLHVLPDPGKAVPTLTLTPPASAVINAAYAISGGLGSSLGMPAGTPLHVSRASTYGTVALPDVTTAEGGAFSIPDTVTQRGTYTYTVSYDGDAERLPAAKTVSVYVRGLTPNVTIATDKSLYAYGASARILAHLGTTHTNRTLSIAATPYGYPKSVRKTGPVSSTGNLSTTYTVARRTTFTATFTGDDRYEPRTVSRTVTVQVKLSSFLTGYYTTSGSYRVYRRTAYPVMDVIVKPTNKGACMSFLVQKYSSGAWRTAGTASCLTLNEYSQTSAVFTGTRSAGVRYRMRTTFLGTTANARTVGPFSYFTFS